MERSLLMRAYTRVVSFMGGLFHDPEKALLKEENFLQRVKNEKKQIMSLQDEMVILKQTHGEGAKKVKKFEAEIDTKKAKLEKMERQGSLKELEEALYFAGLEVPKERVRRGASNLALSAFILLLLVGLAVLVLFHVPLVPWGLVVVLLAIAAPFTIYGIVLEMPKTYAERIKVKSLGRTPEAITYLNMSMALTPSIDRAVEFASENAEEPLASAFRRVLWEVYVRRFSSIEESFMAFAQEWGGWNEDLKRALYLVRSSTLERTEEGLRMTLDKANEVILTGTKARIDEFVASLSTPTTILFTLGILLPMVVGAMLPMMTIGSLQFEMDDGEGPSSGEGMNVWTLVLLMDVAFPLMTFSYAFYILGKRPGTSSPPSLKKYRGEWGHLAVAFGIFAVLSSVPLVVDLSSFNENLAPFFPLLGFGIGSYIIFAYGYGQANEEKERIKRLEDRFPDALFQLGSRIAEGEPLERAVKKVGDSLEGTQMGDLFLDISKRMQTDRGSLKQILTDEKGFSKIPSRTVKATMRTVLEVDRKDSKTAGQTILSISNNLREMAKVENEIQTELSSAMGSMKATGLFFAPVVMGVTAALYVLLSSSLSGMTGGQTIPVNSFIMVMGIFLMLNVATVMYFSAGIERGDDAIAKRTAVGKAMPVSMLIFAVSFFVASGFMG